LVFPSVPTKQIPEVKKTINAITAENAVRDIEQLINNYSINKNDNKLRTDFTKLKQQYEKVFLGTKTASKTNKTIVDPKYMPYHTLLQSKNIINLQDNILKIRFTNLKKKGGMRK